MLKILLTASIAAVVIYYLLFLLINASYANNSYPQLPLSLRVEPFYNAEASTAANIGSGSNQEALIGSNSNWASWAFIYPLYALFVVFIGFGITSLFVPDITFILALPWLAEAFLLGNSQFVDIWYHYFSFAVGGSIIAAILSISAMKNNEKFSRIMKFAPVAIVLFSTLLLYYSQIFSYSKNITSIKQQYYFEPSKFQTQIDQLNYVIGKLPSNASVFTNYFIASHLTQRRFLDVIGSSDTTTYWFRPQFLLVDFNENISQNAFGGAQGTQFVELVNKLNYTLVLRNGSAELYASKR